MTIYGTPIKKTQASNPADVSNIGGVPAAPKTYGTVIKQQGVPSTSDTPTEKQPGYFARVGQDYSTEADRLKSRLNSAGEQISEGSTLMQVNPVGTAEHSKALLKTVGGLLQGGLATAGGVARQAFNPIVELPGIHQGLDLLGKGISKDIANDPVKKQILEGLMSLADAHPEKAKDIQDAVDILTLGTGKAVEKPVESAVVSAAKNAAPAVGGGLFSGGQALVESGANALKKTRDRFVQKLVMPIEDKATRLAQVGRAEEKGKGIFKRTVIAPTPLEKTAQEEVSKIPGVKSGNTYQGNFNAIEQANEKKATDLIDVIKKNEFTNVKQKIADGFDAAQKELATSPTIVGDAQTTAQRLIDGAKNILKKYQDKGSDMLQARKDYDRWVKSQKPNAFDAKTENAFTIANRAVRDTFHTILEQEAPDLGIKQSLREQAALYHAMDNVGVKAANEAKTAVGRVMQKVGTIIKNRNLGIQVGATLGGVGGLGAAALVAPYLTLGAATAGLTYAGARLVLKPELRIAIGNILKQGGRALAPADRAVLVEDLKKIGMSEADITNSKQSLRDFMKGSNPETKLLEAPKKPIKIHRGSTNLSDYYPPSEKLPTIDFGKPGKSSLKKAVRGLKIIK